LKLKEQPPAEEKASAEVEPAVDPEMQVDSSPTSSNLTESFEPVVHFLVTELMKSTRVEATKADPPSSDAGVARDLAASSSETHVVPDNPAALSIDSAAKDRYQYSCFLMQCLTELLFSYDSCKIAFLSYSSKKRSQAPSKETSSKLRTATLHYLLTDLVSFETINPQPNSDARDRITVCNWAMSLIVALCVDSSSAQELKDVSPELVSVRKFVLEAINRTIKDLSSSESVEGRYGRLLALADLCHRLLTVRFNSTSRKQQDDTPTHIAKVMLEKNFVATLTTALSEVDLNYPNVRGLVASILRPLEYLCAIYYLLMLLF
jgi:E3 ubiquitin-protein ligase HUWE1